MKKYILILMTLCLILLPQMAVAAGDLVQSGDITIPAGEKVLGDVVCLQGDVEIFGEVYGDVVALLGAVTLHPEAYVHGDVVSLTGEIEIYPGAGISGDQVSLSSIGEAVSLPSARSIFSFNVGRTVFNIIIRVVLAVFIGLLFPKVLTRAAAQIETHLGPSTGAGTLTWLAALPLAVIVALTIIGIPLSLLVILALWAAYYLGFAAISQLAGHKVLPAAGNPLAALALGALLISVLLAVPLLGVLIRIALALVGVGAVVLTRFGTRETVGR